MRRFVSVFVLQLFLNQDVECLYKTKVDIALDAKCSIQDDTASILRKHMTNVALRQLL